MNEQFQAVMEKKNILESKKPIPEDNLKVIKEKVWLEWIYNSLALDGNSLTLNETKDVLEGKVLDSKTPREQQEVLNHKEVIEYIENLVAKKEPLKEEQLQEINKLLLGGISNKFAGFYKNHEDVVAGDDRSATAYATVEYDMQKLMTWYEENKDEFNFVELSAYMHGLFLGISPFVVDNGKTARFLLSLELMKGGYPPLVITKENGVKYRASLERANITGDYEYFLQYLLSELDKSLDLYLENL
ncbi:Fic/DOC family protein [Desulfonispora thiosulfatigenes DSM 11270]|uniref:Fic/DOC family protein n=1 Tax=Desulfonispora thiosulfatigenes DSM 11270 TaxID=656914 RepID=A0A1W1VFA2_DESTI|nr:Fic family protein [Desulfonispora thiosulfatigenes]SMB92032.1 Fic/DOC family protein [Desulfonispora thiosulfatigenes DSM 11270]